MNSTILETFRLIGCESAHLQLSSSSFQSRRLPFTVDFRCLSAGLCPVTATPALRLALPARPGILLGIFPAVDGRRVAGAGAGLRKVATMASSVLCEGASSGSTGGASKRVPRSCAGNRTAVCMPSYWPGSGRTSAFCMQWLLVMLLVALPWMGLRV